MRGLVDDDDGGDDAVGRTDDVVAVDHAPLIAIWGLTQVMGVTAVRLAAAPAFLADVGTLLPFRVPEVLLMMVLVRMVLGEGDSAGKVLCGERELRGVSWQGGRRIRATW